MSTADNIQPPNSQRLEGAQGEQEEKHTLLLRLAGPMQSWGFRSRFDIRDTALEPTRSGVIGLLCAALGIGRGESSKLEQFQALKMGVRVDAPGRVMVDYHTAQEILRASGGIADTLQSWRYYLADARFLVGLESSDQSLLQVLEDALRNPVWPLSLGRRSFVPSLPIHLAPSGLRAGQSVEQVLRGEAWKRVRRGEKRPTSLRLAIESGPGEGAAVNDVPLDFREQRFGLRWVGTLEPVEDFEEAMEELCISANLR